VNEGSQICKEKSFKKSSIKMNSKFYFIPKKKKKNKIKIKNNSLSNPIKKESLYLEFEK
jgi:hypothetical protein